MNEEDHAQPSAKLIDWIALSNLYDNRQGFIQKLLGIALSSLADMPLKLRKAIKKTDFDDLAFIAHGLKGSAHNLKAPSLLALASETEALARAENPETLSQAEALAKNVECLLAELAGHVDKGSGRSQ